MLKMLLHQQISNESLSLTGEFKEGLRKAKRAKAEEERKDYYALLQVSLSLQSLSVFGDWYRVFFFILLSDPGKPGVRSLGPDVTNKLQDVCKT